MAAQMVASVLFDARIYFFNLRFRSRVTLH